MDVDRATADDIVERLRYGLPPRDGAGALTVGLHEQMRRVEHSLYPSSGAGDRALLVQATRGSGGSHALHAIREMALDAGYAVSLVEAHALEGVRFNRVDTVFGAICRGIEVDRSGRRGIGALFDALAQPPAPLSDSAGTRVGGLTRSSRLAQPCGWRAPAAGRDAEPSGLGAQPSVRGGGSWQRVTDGVGPCRAALSSHGRWDYSEYLRSPAMYVALRAWAACDDQEARLLVASWLADPSAYETQRTRLYESLVYRLRDTFRDPRPAWKFHAEGTLVLHAVGRTQIWDAIDDLRRIALAAGLRGIVLLFDEFEEGVHSLGRADHQQEALHNLLRFFGDDPASRLTRDASGEPKEAMHAYFAVTPDFAATCRAQALRRDVYDLDDAKVEELPSLQIPAMTHPELLQLADKIREVHGHAYGWDASRALPDGALAELTGRLWKTPAPERVRWGIQRVIQALDERLQAGD